MSLPSGIAILLLLSSATVGQETNAFLSGRVLNAFGQGLQGSSVSLKHLPTGMMIELNAGPGGYFRFLHLRPGGPFTMLVSHVGFTTQIRENIFLDLGWQNEPTGEVDSSYVFYLKPQDGSLQEVRIFGKAKADIQRGMDTKLSVQGISMLPSIGRGLQDLLRVSPIANLRAEGSVSIAGQNNRFNAVYIDGVPASDLLGLAANGTNGGVTGSAPISVESLEALHIMTSPYQARYSHFTGASIQAITRSGTNRLQSAAWFFFRNEQLAGKDPVVPGQAVNERQRLPDFFNRNAGAWASGPIIRNKLFYFFLLEKQQDTRPIRFDMASYAGQSSDSLFRVLGAFVQKIYGYDAGDYRLAEDRLDVNRLEMKLDWNAGKGSRFTLGYRLNDATRTSPRTPNSPTQVSFSNSGYTLPSTTHTVSAEWKKYFPGGMSNRLVIGYTKQLENRDWVGQPFPRIALQDGLATIILGADPPSSLNKLEAGECSLSEFFSWGKGKAMYAAGFDVLLADIDDTFIGTYFGNYRFASVNSFLNGVNSDRYSRSYSLIDNPSGDETTARASFGMISTGIFLEGHWKLGKKLSVAGGLRLDRINVLKKPTTDQFFNDSASAIISGYHDLEGARSGEKIRTQWPISPRLSISIPFPRVRMQLQAGTGIFSGRPVNAWFSSVYMHGVGSMDIFSSSNGIPFNPNPYGQPTHGDFGLDPSNARGDLVLTAKHYRFPMVWRSSLEWGWKASPQWTLSVQGQWTMNLREPMFRNLNIMPPIGKSALPDQRDVYSTGVKAQPIPLQSNGSNPYTSITLMTNRKGAPGAAGNIVSVLSYKRKWLEWSASYAFGFSRVYTEITGQNTPAFLQWSTVETIGGRNAMSRTISDNDLGHRLTALLTSGIPWSGGLAMTRLTVFYSGQTGAPYSYVLRGSLVNDVNNQERFDLAYIPTRSDLDLMAFRAYNTPQGTVSAEDQRMLLDARIASDARLRKQRGSYAERNGVRIPFTHSLDLRVQQDFLLKQHDHNVRFSLVFDVFNLLNLLNPRWGLVYTVASDNFRLYSVVGYAQSDQLKPLYEYRPVAEKPYTVQNSTIPGGSARWIGQLGLRVSLE